MSRTVLLAVALLATSCYHAAVRGQFRDQPPVTRIDDRRPIPEPAARRFYNAVYVANVLLLRPVLETLGPPRGGPSLDVNSLEEVPDSTWFENRIGRRRPTPAEAARGADTIGPPVPPLQITARKPGGGNPGFVARDARGISYVIKLDTRANPEQQTGTNAIVARILYQLGYHVPAEHVIHVRRSDIVVTTNAALRTHLSETVIDRVLAPATRRADGHLRLTASQLIAGRGKGGWKTTNTREDDPNDRVPHQRRRTLRGLRVFAAWLGHTDLKEDNTLDVYVGPPGRGYLMHYLIDFGEAFGGHQSEQNQPQIGWEFAWDYTNQLKAFFAFGLWHRDWEHQRPTPWPAVGYFSADHFDPRTWRERLPYSPFRKTDRADAYWATRLILQFDRPLLEAIVATAQFSDPAVAPYLVDTLLARRARIAEAYLDGVTPLDAVAIRNGELCGVDVGRRYGFARDGALVLAGVAHPIASDGAVCIPLPRATGYHAIDVHIQRARGSTPPLQVHYMGGDQPRLLGIIR